MFSLHLDSMIVNTHVLAVPECQAELSNVEMNQFENKAKGKQVQRAMDEPPPKPQYTSLRGCLGQNGFLPGAV